VKLGDEERRALLAAFLADAPERSRRLREALDSLETKDTARREQLLAAARLEAHTLRGAAATVELPSVAGLAAEVEAALDDERAEAARSALDSLDAELAEARRVPRTVLLIDDDPTNRLLVERVAARAPGVALLAAETGREGLELARRESPHLVLLDLRLPDLPGEEVLARLRADAVTDAIPVVVLSGEAHPAGIERLRGLGAADYLTKPLDIEKLVEILRGA
jgi:CheY-like chemotaxis protein